MQSRGWARRWRVVPLVGACVLALLAASCTPAPGASPPEAAAAVAERVRPVIIVPGWEIACVTRQTDWDHWTDAFVQAGVPADQVRVAFYDTCQPNLDTAEMIGRTVDELLRLSGADKVNVIAHSMGAISTRWCVRFGGCVGKVAQVVTLSGANHGTIWAEACGIQFWARSCPDMHPESEMLALLNTEEAPAGVGWETWVSVCELAIVPRESTFLAGAVNHDLVDECVDHSGWKWHRPTIESVVSRLVPHASAAAAS